jgi:hypothetical protein
MSSDLQIEANRRNSRKSTGPRTATGKATSSRNSTQSGIFAEAEVIHDENPSDLDSLVADYIDRFHPDAPEQRCLIDILAHSEWTLRRLRRAEAQLWARNIETSESSFDENTLELGRAVNYNESRVFSRLQSRITATQRNYERALKEVQRLQIDRPIQDPATKFQPVSALQSASAQIGFVLSPVPPPPPNPPLPPAAAQFSPAPPATHASPAHPTTAQLLSDPPATQLPPAHPPAQVSPVPPAAQILLALPLTQPSGCVIIHSSE